MSNSFFDTLSKLSYNAELNLSLTDSMLKEIIDENITPNSEPPIELVSSNNRLIISTEAPVLGMMSKKASIKLKYEGYFSSDREALLVFKTDDQSLIDKLFVKLVEGLVLYATVATKYKSHSTLSLSPNSLIIDLYEVLPKIAPTIPLKILNLVKDIKIAFKSGIINISISFDNELKQEGQ